MGTSDLVALLGGAFALAEVLEREAPDEVLVRVASVDEQRELDAVVGTAVLEADDDVLRDVDQTTGEVPGVGRTQGGVGEALAGTVGRDEVLENREAFHEVGLDRTLDRLALRVGHEATHTRQLADLLEGTTSAGVGHHVDRVEHVEVLRHGVTDFVGGRVPLGDDRFLALDLRDQAHLVLVLDVGDAGVVAREDLALVRRRDDVVLGHRDAGARGVLEADVLEGVQDERDRGRAVVLDQAVDHRDRVLLLHRLVHEHVTGGVEAVADGDREGATRCARCR